MDIVKLVNLKKNSDIDSKLIFIIHILNQYHNLF